MKKVIMKTLTLFLAIITICGLAACNDTKQQDGKVDGPVNVSGNITFSFEANTEGKQAAADAYIDAFEQAYPNASVKRDYDYTISQIDTRISAGQIGDVFFLPEVWTYNYAVTHNALMPLEYYLEALEININDVYSGIYSAGMINGSYYYVPKEFSQQILIYNKDYIESRGLTERVTEEWTWNEFLSICEELTDDTHYGADFDLTYDPNFLPLLNAYIGQNNWFDTAKKEVDFTSGDTLKAIEEIVTAAKSGYINIGVSTGDAFTDKKAVFQDCAYIHVDTLGKQYEQASIEWDMINMPLTPYPAFGCGSSGVGVYNRTQNPDTAAAFALFFYTREGQLSFHSQFGGCVPVLASLKEESFWRHPDDDWSDKNWDAHVYKAEDYAVIGRFACVLPQPVADVITGSLRDTFSAIMANRSSIEDAFEKLETQANETWQNL